MKTAIFGLVALLTPILITKFYLSSFPSQTNGGIAPINSVENNSTAIEGLKPEDELLSKRHISPGVEADKTSLDTKLDSFLDLTKPPAHVEIRSNDFLDPDDDGQFLLAARVRFESLPSKAEKNVLLISKFEENEAPYAGWAVGVRKKGMSLRPQVYLKSNSGEGEWYSFDSVTLNAKKWYSFFVLLSKENGLALYFRADDSPSAENKVTFAGGYQLGNYSFPSTKADLVIGSKKSGELAFQGKFHAVFLAKLKKEISGIEDAEALFNQPLKELYEGTPAQEVSLYVSGSGEDKSELKNKLSFLGNSVWTKN